MRRFGELQPVYILFDRLNELPQVVEVVAYYREEFFVADFMVEVHEAVAVADHLNESGLHMSWDNSESRQVAGDTFVLLGEFGMTTLGENVAPHIEDGF